MLYHVTLQRDDGRQLVTSVSADTDEKACAAAVKSTDPAAGYRAVRVVPAWWNR